ncbi:MAG TPA: hypothetical protein VMU32_05405 [Solirubrobacteraceae bacterium]|nr:hypothetical protein [Solirubrobacteraceae bacterium]
MRTTTTPRRPRARHALALGASLLIVAGLPAAAEAGSMKHDTMNHHAMKHHAMKHHEMKHHAMKHG